MRSFRGLSFFLVALLLQSQEIQSPPTVAPPSIGNNPIVTQQGVAPTAGSAVVFKSIIPPSLVDTIFGHRLSRSYLAIQVTVFDTSADQDILINDVSVDYGKYYPDECQVVSSITPLSTELTGVGFRTIEMMGKLKETLNVPTDLLAKLEQMPLKSDQPVTNGDTGKNVSDNAKPICQASGNDLTILRGVAERGQYEDPRNVGYRVLQAVGEIGGALTGVAGLGPVLPRAVAAFNGPGINAYTTALPDFTLNQMNRLSDSAYSANTLVPKQRSKVMVVFIPLQLFFTQACINLFVNDPYSAYSGKAYPKDTKGNCPVIQPNGASSPVGLKDLKIRVAYNFVVATQDVPPIPSTVSIDDKELLNFLNKQDVHGLISGRFLDGAVVGAADTNIEAKLDGAKTQTAAQLYFILTPKKVMFPPTVDLTVTKNKDSSSISKPNTAAQPKPALTKLDPSQITVGADQDITLTGNNFFDIPAVLAFSSKSGPDTSIEVSNLNVVSPTTIKATISAKNAKAGSLDLSVLVGKLQTGAVALKIVPKP